MVDSLRGAWTWAHVWMDVDTLVLHAEFDWMREPLFDRGSRAPSDAGCAQELEMYPRAQEFIPAWMAEGARRHRLVAAPVDVDVLDLLARLFPETADIDGNGLFVWPESREGAEERVGRVLEAWLPTTGARRVDIDCYVLDRYDVLDTRLRMADGAAVVVTLTEPEAWFWGEKVREVMAVPGRGAWTHAHVWMEAGDLVLRCEYEWDERPPFLDDMIDKERTHWLEAELRRFPRTPEHTPTWLVKSSPA